jgi:hypothetical protein
MTLDIAELYRKALAVAPRWVRWSFLTSLIVGEILQVIDKILFNGNIWLSIDPAKLDQHEWVLLGIALTMPPSFLWHIMRRARGGLTPYEKAEEYIAILKLVSDDAHRTPAQKQLFWSGILSRLADEFAVGKPPPDAKALATRVKNDLAEN